MTIRYRITYLDNQSSGWSFFGFRRSTRREKCEKCKMNHAIMAIVESTNPDNKMNLCTVCYNEYSAEELLTPSVTSPSASSTL